MNIPKAAWYNRVYEWWHYDKYGWLPARDGFSVNLCPYMRAILFWSWTRLLFLPEDTPVATPASVRRRVLNVFSYASALTLVNLIIHHMLKSRPSLLKVFVVEAIIALSAVTIIGSLLGGFWLSERVAKWRRSRRAGQPESVPFSAVVKEWAKATHDRVCPVISVGVPPPQEPSE